MMIMMHLQRGDIWVKLLTIHVLLLWRDVITVDYPAEYSIQVDKSVTVPEGLCVTIPCNFTANYRTKFTKSTAIWMEDTTKVAFSDQNKGSKSNFHVTGNPDLGNCALTIANAGREDSGTYYFRFEESPKSRVKFSYVEYPVQVNVTDLKEEPHIPKIGKLIAGKEVNLTCIPPGNCVETPAIVEWEKSDYNGTWKTSANVTFIPTKSDHQTFVTCKTILRAGKKNVTKTKKQKLNVQYPPSITVTTADDITVDRYVNVSERVPAMLICKADSNPEADVTWHKGNNIVLKNKTSAALLINATSHGIYQCSAWNEIGLDLRYIEVSLQGTPGTPSSQCLINGETTVQDLFIGIACGIAISLIVFLLFKFCSRKQLTLKSDHDPSEGSLSTQDFPIGPKCQKAGNPSNSSDSTDVNYASIKFSKVVTKTESKQPETEYAEIKFS